MKKILFTLIALCVMTSGFAQGKVQPTRKNTTIQKAAANSPSLIGSWVTDFRSFVDNDGSVDFRKADLVLTFNPTGANINMDAEIAVETEGETLLIGLNVAGKGTYKKNGNMLTINFSSSKPVLTVTKVKMSQRMEEMLKMAGMSTNSIKQMMLDELKNDKDVTEMFSELNGDLRIEKHTSTQLVLTEPDDGTTLSFTRR